MPTHWEETILDGHGYNSNFRGETRAYGLDIIIISCACIRKCIVHGMGMHDALFTYTSVLMGLGLRKALKLSNISPSGSWNIIDLDGFRAFIGANLKAQICLNNLNALKGEAECETKLSSESHLPALNLLISVSAGHSINRKLKGTLRFTDSEF